MGPQWLLLCVALIAGAHSHSPTSPRTPSAANAESLNANPSSKPTNAPHPETSHLATPETARTTARSTTTTTTISKATVSGGGLATNTTWLDGIMAFAGRPSKSPSFQGNNSRNVFSSFGQLPGLVQGLGGNNLKGNDVAKLLASLFSDPRAEGIPAWIEALMVPDSNTSQSLQGTQRLLQSFSQQDPNDQLQALLAKVFTDVTEGLQSLNVTASSTSQDVISAILNDHGLRSSLSSETQLMMGVIADTEELQQLLQWQLTAGSRSANQSPRF